MSHVCIIPYFQSRKKERTRFRSDYYSFINPNRISFAIQNISVESSAQKSYEVAPSLGRLFLRYLQTFLIEFR